MHLRSSRVLPSGALAALTVSAVALAGCGGPAGGAATADTPLADKGFSELTAEGSPVDGGSLTYATNQEPDCLDPHVSGLNAVAAIDRNVVDSLVSIGPDGTARPWLATSWTTSSDLRTYTFTLRDDVTFHDGAPLDAAAVKANFDRIAAPETESHLAVTLLGPYESTTVVDEKTVEVRFTQPYAPFLQAASTTNLGLLSPASFAKGCKQIVGSGPFAFEAWHAGQDVVLTRNTAYRHGDPAHLAEVTFRFLPDESVRLGALRSGQADLAYNLSPISVRTVEADTSLSLLAASPPGGVFSLYLNNASGPLSDERVRVAVQRALDLDTIVASASANQYDRAWSPISPATPGYDASLEDSWPHDTKLAGEKLDAAGWRDRDADGYRTKDSERLRLVWLSPAVESPNQVQAAIAQLIQASLKEIGIELVLDSVPVGTYLDRAYRAFDYDVFGSAYGGGDPDVLRLEFSSANRPKDGTPDGNVTLLAEPEVDRWLDEGVATADPEARAEAYAKVQKYVTDHAVAIPVYVPTTIGAVSAKVRGLTWDPSGFPRLHGAWVVT
jgi:peptide/nickel transport system substrate-binding protein